MTSNLNGSCARAARFAGAAANAESVWDSALDFNLDADPGDAWSVEWWLPGGSAVAMAFCETDGGSPRLSSWSRDGVEPALPSAAIDMTDGPIEWVCAGVSLNLPILSPGEDGLRSVVTWTAPAAGCYLVLARFKSIDLDSTAVQVRVDLDSTPLASKALSGFGNTLQFRLKGQLNAGQTLCFAVDACCELAGDSTELKLAILRLAPAPGATLQARSS